jgi:hypothetical protein
MILLILGNCPFAPNTFLHGSYVVTAMHMDGRQALLVP